MIQWFLDREWLPQIYFSICASLIFGLVDASIQGYVALLPALLITASIAFSRTIPWLAVSLIGLGSLLELWLKVSPLISGVSASISLILLAAFSAPFIRQVSVITTNALGIVIAYVSCIQDSSLLLPLGIKLAADNSGFLAFGLATVCVIAVNSLAWVYGRLIITKWMHVGTDNDRALLVTRQAALGIEIAKQTERLGIARDLTDLLVQRLTAVVSLSEGAKYLAKTDRDATERVIERIAEASSSAQTELRKLYDLLHVQHALASAPPALSEIPDLILAMRQLGFDAALKVDGSPLKINEGAELCIFKIVFEALENVKKHAPVGTSISVDFYWTSDGLQVLVKDNGIEFAQRSIQNADELMSGYTVQDDLTALVANIEGATLATLRERASLYAGTIEATRVPGVGFTLAAYFPTLREVAGA